MPTSKFDQEVIPDVCFNLSHRKFSGPTEIQPNGFNPKRGATSSFSVSAIPVRQALACR